MAERSKALESGGSSTFDHNAHVSSPKGRGFESHFRHLFFCYFISFLKCAVFLSVHENIRPKFQPTLIRGDESRSYVWHHKHYLINYELGFEHIEKVTSHK